MCARESRGRYCGSMVKKYLDNILKTIQSFFQEGNPLGSSKRLIVILTFISAIGVNWYSVIKVQDLTDNQLYIALAIVGMSTGNYLIGNRKITKEDSLNG